MGPEGCLAYDLLIDRSALADDLLICSMLVKIRASVSSCWTFIATRMHLLAALVIRIRILNAFYAYRFTLLLRVHVAEGLDELAVETR